MSNVKQIWLKVLFNTISTYSNTIITKATVQITKLETIKKKKKISQQMISPHDGTVKLYIKAQKPYVYWLKTLKKKKARAGNYFCLVALPCFILKQSLNTVLIRCSVRQATIHPISKISKPTLHSAVKHN